MEGMPRLPMLSPEPKVPANEYDDEFVLQIKEYILMHFQADPSAYDAALNEIKSLKKQITRGHIDVEATCTLKRYYAQLLMMKNRFPMEKGDPINVLFSWYERATEIPSAHTHSDIVYELSCVMYQIGAIHGNIGALETRQSEDSIKNAFMHFQYAAWPFQNLRDSLDLGRFNTSDFDKDMLTFYVNILLGQAQECLVEKSLVDHRSSVVVSKLSIYLRDLYMECYKHLENSVVGEIVSSSKFKYWSRTCLIKSELYGCLAMLYMGMKADDEKKFGDRLGYYQAADVHLQRCLKCCAKEDREDIRDSVRFVSDVVTAKLENAKKENDFIYHERIPKIEDLLSSVEGLCKVKPLSFDPLDPSVGGDDIFGYLLPPTVLSSVSQYEEEKAKLKRDIKAKVDDKDNELQTFLLSLNISELSLDKPEEVRLPDMLLERNAALNSQTDAVPRLLEQLQRVSDLAREADSKLSALSSRLDVVDLPELTADEGYQAIKQEIARLSEHHTLARSNNTALHNALAAHTTNLHLLSLPYRELAEKLAPQTAAASIVASKECEALKRILAKTNEMQSQRVQLMQQLSEELQNDNISKRLLAERDCDNQASFAKELEKHEKTIKYLEQNLSAQTTILFHLTEANADFAEQRRQMQDSNQRLSEQVITLVTAFDVYSDVCNKADDGKRFYEKLIDRVNKLGCAVDGIEIAYQEEVSKRHAEKHALEEKMAALRAAREARDAMADFGGVSGGVSPAQALGFAQDASSNDASATTARGGRPRLGDYMEFYRNKMGGKGAPQPAPQSQPSYQHPGSVGGAMPLTPYGGQSISPLPPRYGGVPPHQQQYHPVAQHMLPSSPAPSMQPPSPAPSSVADYHYSPRVDGPVTAPAMHPHYQQVQHPPTMMPSYNQYNGHVLPQSTMPPASQLPPMVPQQPQQIPASASPYHAPAATQQHPSFQAQPVPMYQQSHQQNYSNGQMNANYQPAPTSFPPPMSHMAPQAYQHHSLVPPTSQQSGQDVVNRSVHQQQQQQFVLPPANVPNHSGQPLPAGVESPFRPVQPASHYAPVSPIVPEAIHHIPVGPVPTNAPTSTQPGAPPMNYSQSSIGGTPVPQYQQQHLPPAARPSPDDNRAPILNYPVGGGSVAETPILATPSPATFSSAALPPSRQLPAQQQPNSSSPWHRNVAQPPAPSPWHQHNAPLGGAPASQIPQQYQQTFMPNQASFGGPSANSSHTQSNVDLLSSLLGDLQLPAPLQPSATSPSTTHPQQHHHPVQESQYLQRAAPSLSNGGLPLSNGSHSNDMNGSSSTNQNGYQMPGSAPLTAAPPVVSRPAATVMPMVHNATSANSDVDSPILSMVNPSTVSVLPQPSLCKQQCGAEVQGFDEAVARAVAGGGAATLVSSLSDLSDPSKFCMGEGDRLRLERRQLHQAIRSDGPLPPLDPNDPLNQLDPFWKAANK